MCVFGKQFILRGAEGGRVMAIAGRFPERGIRVPEQKVVGDARGATVIENFVTMAKEIQSSRAVSIVEMAMTDGREKGGLAGHGLAYKRHTKVWTVQRVG